MTKAANDLLGLLTDNLGARLSQRQVYERLLEKGDELSWNESQNQHNDHCRKLKDLVDEINMDPSVDAFVYQADYLYSIATEREAEEMLANYYDRAMKALSRYSKMLRKARRDGQGMTVDNLLREVPATDGRFHEAYPKPEPKAYIRVEFVDRENGVEYPRSATTKVPESMTDAEIAEWLKTLGTEVRSWERI